METSITHHQKIERLEAEKRQLEDRIRQLKHAAQTAERKRLTRVKIILGSLMLRNHSELLPQLIAEASPQDAEFLRSFFPQMLNEGSLDSPASASVRRPLYNDVTEPPEPFSKGEAHLRIAGVFPRCWCVSAVGGEGSLPLAGHPLFFPTSQDASLLKWRSFISPFDRSAGPKDTAPMRK